MNLTSWSVLDAVLPLSSDPSLPIAIPSSEEDTFDRLSQSFTNSVIPDLTSEQDSDPSRVFDSLDRALNRQASIPGIFIETNILSVAFDTPTFILNVESLKILMLLAQDHPELTHLLIHNCRFNQASWDCFIEGLKELKHLEKLIFIGCQFSPEELTTLAEVAASLPHLASLSFEDQLVDTPFIEKLRPVLTDNSKLKELCFSHCQVNGETALSLSKFVKCPYLSRLFLNDNPLGEEGLDALSQLLQTHDGIAVLSLSNCLLNNASLTKLGTIFAERSEPLDLDLENNEFDEKGVSDLSEKGFSILRLRLDHNKNLKRLSFIEHLLIHPVIHFIQINSQLITDESLEELESLTITSQQTNRRIQLVISFGDDSIDTPTFKLLVKLETLLAPVVFIQILPLQIGHFRIRDAISMTSKPTQEVLDLILDIKNPVENWEKESLFAMLLELTFHICPIPKDGNCLFASIAAFLPQWDAFSLRQEVVKVIKNNRDEFRIFLLEEEHAIENLDERFNQYVLNMVQPGTWGGNIELSALTLLLKEYEIDRPIYIFDLANPPTVVDGQFVVRDLLIFGKECQGEPICLYRQGQSHYEALIPKTRRLKRPADAITPKPDPS